MLTVNLEKQLVRQNRKLITPKELLKLKEYDTYSKIANDNALERIGLSENMKKGYKIKSRVEGLRQQTSRFNQERVFHISQIESLCRKYHLKFLPSKMYKGTIDEGLPESISTFEVAYGVRCGDRNCNIAAPAKSFRLSPRPKDPLLFYEINDEYYYLIKKWGNDLNVFRRLVGVFATNMAIGIAFGVVFVASIIFGIIFLESLFGVSLLVIMIGVFAGLGLICMWTGDRVFDKDWWKSEFEN
jgi:hypothetical protein